jgi:hypothetical protein
MSSCLAALIVSCVAGGGGLFPIFYAAAYRPGMLSVSALAATVIRLLLMIAGSAIVIIFVKVNILWFVVWIGMFYLVVLVLEIRFTIRCLGQK